MEAGYTGADAYVKLDNEHDTPARCELLFKNGPEARARIAQLMPRSSVMVVGGLMREVVRLRISLECKPDS